MAYISALDDDEENKQPGAAPAAPQPPASRFVNFSQYLNANRGAAQATAGKIAGDINTQGEQVSTDFDKAQQGFNSGVQNGSQTYNPTADAHVGAAKTYTGPNALGDNAAWGSMQDRARKVSDTAQATASSGGLGAILQDQNRGAYGGGARRLDSAVTGYVGADDFARARERYGKMSDTLNSANAASVTTADAARAGTDTAREMYKGQAGAQDAAAATVAGKVQSDKDLATARDSAMKFFKETFGEDDFNRGGVGPALSGLSLPALQELESMREDVKADPFYRAVYAKRMMDLVKNQRVHVVGQR